MKNKPKVAIIDYGVGNIYSVHKALEQFVDQIHVINTHQSLQSFDMLVLPGVGAYAAGMTGLKNIDMIDEVKNFAASGRPVLGICLGAQLLLTKSTEFGVHEGLDIVPGVVEKIDCQGDVKIPHIGWNTIECPDSHGWGSRVLDGIRDGESMYFVHSYICTPSNIGDIVAQTHYGGIEFCSIFERGNVTGVQFHPEKSGSAGLKIIENFLNLSL